MRLGVGSRGFAGRFRRVARVSLRQHPVATSRHARAPMTLVERAARLREKMIATALLDLEDWSPVRPPPPIADDDEPGVRVPPPPIVRRG